jgi:hypothetical protein
MPTDSVQIDLTYLVHPDPEFTHVLQPSSFAQPTRS